MRGVRARTACVASMGGAYSAVGAGAGAGATDDGSGLDVVVIGSSSAWGGARDANEYAGKERVKSEFFLGITVFWIGLMSAIV